MPHTISTTVYSISELDETAREKARDWYRTTCFDGFWNDDVFSDFRHVCSILGLTLRSRPVRTVSGAHLEKPCIYYSGFCSQGDGASFEASYSYARGSSAAIAQCFEDETLTSIAQNLQAIQRRYFYQLSVDVRQSGRYVHSNTMLCEATCDGADVSAETHDALDTEFRRLADWLYRKLEDAYDHYTSDPVVDDALLINDYTFTADGARFG